MNTMLPDIPRIYTALAEWGACVIYLMTMRRRLKGWRFFPASLCALAIQSVFLVATKDISIYFWVPCMMGAVALMFIFIFSCGEIRAIDAGYYCVRAFVLAELAASLEWQLHCFFLAGWRNSWNLGTDCTCIGLFSGICLRLAA
ncbi:MAG: ATP-binding protein [Oscillospiraceae bacterium]|jgi:hypothetical protein|nr:ATP-binding protein [Oscillospiraceae bacterium]